MTVEVESNFDAEKIRAEQEEGTRIFLRYEVDIKSSLATGRIVPWKILYAFIAGIRPIAGEVKHNKGRTFGDDEKPDAEMWFISRVPALPDDLFQMLKDHQLDANVRISRWAWTPTGLKDLPEEDIEKLETAFNSNLVAWKFLSDEEDKKE